jgi:hypothetical protein
MKALVLNSLGFEVLGYQAGVYHLQRRTEGAHLSFDGVALLYAPKMDTREIHLFLRNRLEEGALAPEIEDLVDLWAGLDARRLEEAGLEPVRFVRDAEVFGTAGAVLEIPRPEGGVRHVVKMETGELVCWN